MRDLEAVWVN